MSKQINFNNYKSKLTENDNDFFLSKQKTRKECYHLAHYVDASGSLDKAGRMALMANGDDMTPTQKYDDMEELKDLINALYTEILNERQRGDEQFDRAEQLQKQLDGQEIWQLDIDVKNWDGETLLFKSKEEAVNYIKDEEIREVLNKQIKEDKNFYIADCENSRLGMYEFVSIEWMEVN